MDPSRALRRVAAAGVGAVALLLLVLLFWPSDDPWSLVARFIVGAFVLPMALGIGGLAVAVLRGWRGSEIGALVLLAIAGLFLTGSAAGAARWAVLVALAVVATPLVLLVVAARGKSPDAK